MKEKNMFKRIIKMFPSTSLMIFIILISLAIPGVLYLVDSESFAEDSTFEVDQIIIIMLVLLGVCLVIDYIIPFVKKISAKNKENKELKEINIEKEKEDFIKNNLEKVKDDAPHNNEKVDVVVNNQNDLDYIAITNGQIIEEKIIPDNLNELIKKDKLYTFKNDNSNLYVELFIKSGKYNFKIDCNNVKQLYLTTLNQVMNPYSLTIMTNDDSRLVVREDYGSNIDNLKKIVDYIKSINSSAEVINETVYEGYKVSYEYINPLVIDYKYSYYKKEVSNRVIEHKIERIPFDDIRKIEYTNYDTPSFSYQTNFLKIYTSKCVFVILYDHKIDYLIQNLSSLPLEQVNDLINRKWYFGKDDEGAACTYYETMEENKEHDELNKEYRKDSYILNKKVDELNQSKTYSSLRKDGTSFEVTFYYNTNGFNKYDIKSNGQIMLLSEEEIDGSFIDFIDHDCYEVERFDDVGDNLYVNTNYAFIYNSRSEYLIGFDINDVKSIEFVTDDIHIFKIYTKDGSMVEYMPLIEYGTVDDIFDTFLIINPDIIVNRS